MAMAAEAADEAHSDYADRVIETATEFKVHTGVYTDPSIFESEMRDIFEKTWVYVAHESEVRHPGDYRTTYIGRQPVIVSRSDDGSVHVLLNMCRHCGKVVRRDARGQASFFRCAYHGWVYDKSGGLAGVAEQHGYAQDLAVDGLVPVSRVATYRGLIFASLRPDIEDFEDYLGGVREYVDLWAQRSPEGNVRVVSPHRYLYSGNWKYQGENGTDGYHGRYVHESAFRTQQHFHGTTSRDERKIATHGVGRTMGFPRGHGILERPGTRGELPAELLQEYMDSLVSQHGAKRAEEIAMVRHVFIFPSVYLMDDNIRVVQPVATARTEVASYFTVLGGVPSATNNARLANLQWRHSQAGVIGTDDMEMFIGCQSGMQATASEWIVLSRGLHREVTHPSGRVEGQSSDETPQRAIYREWSRLMSRPS